MADEKIWRDDILGPLQLGAWYPEVGPGLGHLYDVRQVETGRAALMLWLGDRVEWQLDGPWRARLLIDPVKSSVTVLVEDSPPAARITELTDAFVLVTTALQTVEESPQAQAHLVSGVTEARTVRRAQVHRAWRGLAARALAGASVLAVGVGLWLDKTGVEELHPLPLDDSSSMRASTVVQLNLLGSAPPAYPLPKVPFENQAAAPLCKKKGVVEINGGCWVELAQKPPCNDDEAEHQGKCYLPVSKPENKRPPQSVQP